MQGKGASYTSGERQGWRDPVGKRNPSSFLRDETREGRGDGARGLEPTGGKSGRSEGDKRRESEKGGGNALNPRLKKGVGGNQNSRGHQWLRTQVASGMGEEPRTRGIRGVLPSGGVGVGDQRERGMRQASPKTRIA